MVHVFIRVFLFLSFVPKAPRGIPALFSLSIFPEYVVVVVVVHVVVLVVVTVSYT